MTKKATRFNEKQKKYLEEKFFLGQETGHKVEAVTVAQEMRYAKMRPEVGGSPLMRS